MMKRTGQTAGEDFGDNRVPGKGQKARKSLTTVPELDNQPAVIKTHRDRVRLFPGEVGNRGRCEPHRLGFLTHSGGERTRPRRRLPEAHRASFRPSCDAHTSRRRARLAENHGKPSL